MQWDWELVGKGSKQLGNLPKGNRAAMMDEFDALCAELTQHGRAVDVDVKALGPGIWRVKKPPYRAGYRVRREAVLAADGIPQLDAKGQPVMRGILEVYKVGPRGDFYKG